ncbi:MAG: glycerophosphodiester phosphodiesterase [Cyanobacteria bacterium]|nr:glycerophosphodiester phosphodiesterase [Cyanobacteriota bacterium]
MTNIHAQVFAHRGGRAWAPENTMIAFRKSLEAGVDGIELDVQRCASGELVVFHDDALDRTTNGAGLLMDCTFDELRRLSAGDWYASDFKAEKVPTLQEVLALVDGQATINVEVKNTPFDYPGIDDDLIACLSDYPHSDKIIISSFDHRLIKQIATKQPEWHYANLMVGVPLNIGSYQESLHAKFWHPSYDCMNASAVQEARNHGVSVNCWTVNGPRDWASVLYMNVDGIITDDPEGLINFLRDVADAQASEPVLM